MNEQQRQAYLDQINYGRIERVIAYKNVQFIIKHQHDGLEQLTAYLKSCMEDIGHPPAMVEVIGGEYIEYRRLMASCDPFLLCRKNHKHQKTATFS